MESLSEEEIKIEYFEEDSADPLRVLKNESVYQPPATPVDQNSLLYKLLMGETTTKNQQSKDSAAKPPQEQFLSNTRLMPSTRHNRKSPEKLTTEHHMRNTESQLLKGMLESKSPAQSKPKIPKGYSVWYQRINDDGKFQCKFCNLSYSTVQSLRAHVFKKHPTDAVDLREKCPMSTYGQRLTCRSCNETFDSVYKLKSHVLMKHPIGECVFICDYCLKVFKLKSELVKHIGNSHSDSSGNFYKVIRKNVTPKKKHKYQCQICGHVAKRAFTLSMHLRMKHRADPGHIYWCPFCPYNSFVKYYIQSHILSKHPQSDYAKSKPLFFCDICSYKTYKRSHFNLHRKNHTDDVKKHKCSYCEYSTNLLSNLDVHTRKHTNEKPFSCDFDECDYKCSSKTALKRHMLKHEPDKNMLYCDRCNYKTVYRSSLKKHIDTHLRNLNM